MGLTEIRTALKVDLAKPADQQPGLHVLEIGSHLLLSRLTYKE